ncbi:LysE family translocator [Xanthomonas sp. AmX2]|uniref:LysE family translocator n=1 Tax=Xanthomonas sp. TaxID=29446 RepID=UPI00197CB80E|nr:LysE family translocator [Xanthomonas sp.]MBN6149530.1 LysE family translocator [Xanthomonas sp.]
MSLHTWWLFFATVFVLSGTPGPNMLHVMTRSVSYGVRRSVAAMAGCLVAVVLVLAASAAGLGALLATSPRLFEALRYVGVAYLIWLGIKAWRNHEAPLDVGAAALAPAVSRARLFRGGLLIGLSNPKLLLFAAAFLPQFVDPALPQWPQFALLVATFALCELFWYAMYGLGGHRLRVYLARPALRRLFDRLTGAIFVGFGVLLLRFRPH